MKRIGRFLKPYGVRILLIALFSVGCSVANVYLIDLLKQMVDSTLLGGSRISSSLWELAFKAVVIILIGMLSNYMVVRTTDIFGAEFLRDMRRDLVKHMMKLAPDVMEKRNFGDMMERLSSDTAAIAGYMQTYFKDCLYVPIVVLVFGVYLISMHPMLAIACLGPLMVMVPLSIRLLQPVKLAQAEYVKKLGFTNNHIQEVFDGADVMKAYELQGSLRRRYYNALKETLHISHKNDLWQYNIEPLSALIKEAPTAIALCVGGYLALQGEVSLGILVAFINGIAKIKEPLVYAYQLVIRTQMAMVSVKRILEVLDLPTEYTAATRMELTKYSATVFDFKQVSFAYGKGTEGDDRLLQQFDLSVAEGKRIALVGASGSGKSTLIKLMCRQYEADEGEIYFYGNPFSKLEPEVVRKHLALISQEAVIFPMSVLDNIRMGKPDAGREAIVEAAKMAGCHDFISALPDAYDTLLEERGNNLSGGQRQRIAIARAILKDAPILLLDEPTSALDRETETYVNETLREISVEKTVITIAHRLNTIVDYDEILVLEQGQIVERGNHETLMDANGKYCALYREYTLSGGMA